MAVCSLGVIPSINIFAKETCLQGAFLLNDVCAMGGMLADAKAVRSPTAAEVMVVGHMF